MKIANLEHFYSPVKWEQKMNLRKSYLNIFTGFKFLGKYYNKKFPFFNKFHVFAMTYS